MQEQPHPTACTVCGNEDVTTFQYNYDDNTTTCTQCGAMLDSIGWAEYIQMVPPPPKDADAKTKRKYKGTYNRRAYIVERIAASCMCEPEIKPDEHKDIIKAEYEKYSNRSYFERLRAQNKLINKKDIQSILRSIDKRNGNSKFTTKYLEKWKSIKNMLGAQVRVYTPEESIRVGSSLCQWSGLWNDAQPPSRAEDPPEQRPWVFKYRKDFPSLNYMIRRLHKKHGIKGMDSSFPLPVTKGSTGKLSELAEYIDPTRPKYVQPTLLDIIK
jgi:hypothetical protein